MPASAPMSAGLKLTVDGVDVDQKPRFGLFASPKTCVEFSKMDYYKGRERLVRATDAPLAKFAARKGDALL